MKLKESSGKKFNTSTLLKICNAPLGALKASAKKEKYGYTIKYTHPNTGSNHSTFLSQARIDKYLKGELKESSEQNMKLKELLKESVIDMAKTYRFGAEVRPLETMPSLGHSDYSAMSSLSQKTEERHDVAMTMSNVQSIVQAATELLSKLQIAQESTELPAWIEDHISRADDLINQAAKGYYEEHNESEQEDQGEVRHYIREKETDSEPLYTDWDEFVNPDRIVVHLKNGKKLLIAKKTIKGGSRVYNAVSQAFRDERYDLLNPIISKMVDKNNIKEKLSKKQQQLDVDKDGEIEASDFKKLRAKK